MSAHFLIVYGSKYGGTAEICEYLAQIIQDKGLSVHVAQASQIDNLEAFDKIILASSVYIGQWHKDVIKFLKVHQDVL